MRASRGRDQSSQRQARNKYPQRKRYPRKGAAQPIRVLHREKVRANREKWRETRTSHRSPQSLSFGDTSTTRNNSRCKDCLFADIVDESDRRRVPKVSSLVAGLFGGVCGVTFSRCVVISDLLRTQPDFCFDDAPSRASIPAEVRALCPSLSYPSSFSLEYFPSAHRMNWFKKEDPKEVARKAKRETRREVRVSLLEQHACLLWLLLQLSPCGL